MHAELDDIYFRAGVVFPMESGLTRFRTFVLSFKCTSYFLRYVFRILKCQPVFKSKYSKAGTLRKLVSYFVFFNLGIITMSFSSTTPARDPISGPHKTTARATPPSKGGETYEIRYQPQFSAAEVHYGFKHPEPGFSRSRIPDF